MKLASLIRQLTELGLSDLEARTYVALLKSGPATAYTVGRAIARPTANVYKAADALEARGAVVSVPGPKRILQAVEPEQFLAQLRRGHTELLDAASRGLRSVVTAPGRVGLARIENVDAVFERALAMLESATAIAAVDCFPASVARLAPAIESAFQRGVAVYVQVYEPVRIRCTSLVVVARGEEIVRHWKSEQVNLACDAREVLLALCSPSHSTVIEAYWSSSLYLACMQQAGLLREHAFHQVHELLERREAEPAAIRRVLTQNPNFTSMKMPGQQALAAQIAHAEERS
ncbi:MAG: hypothetical protein AMXMBFR58_00880 [Phycisphaerae bacterium]